jgi:hypothetical protein
LNITPPAISTFSVIFFTKTTARKLNGMVSYRKPPRKLDKDVALNAVGNEDSKNIHSYRIYRKYRKGGKAAAGGPSVGTKVHMIFEVSPENTRHPHSWLRLPTTCLFEDAPRAMRLAIRLGWKNGNEMDSEYLLHSHGPFIFDSAPGHEGQYDGMGLAIDILNHLENKEIVGPTPKRQIVRDFGTTRVLEATSDHLRQLVELRILTDPPQLIKDAGPRSQSTIH